jgi:2-C-methyl-D-erythritol 4-phosphate cytidylyltransferase
MSRGRRSSAGKDAAGVPAAILAAGGHGKRSGSSIPKQFLLLAGRSVLARSLDAVLAAGCRPCFVAAPADRLELARAEVHHPDVVVVAGGSTRQGSVRAALGLVESATVVVHDAARPLVSVSLFDVVLEALTDADGAVPGVAVDETLKRVRAGVVETTVARDCLYRVQTPQAFRTTALKEAHDRAERDGFESTDDAQLLERLGYRVRLVDASAPNPKLTYPKDFELAEMMLRA